MTFICISISCAPQSRMGMVLDKATGLQFGSVTDRSFLIDPNQLSDKRLKIRIRNTSGDRRIDLKNLTSDLQEAYGSIGYTIARGNEYGMLIDINLRYSGQTTKTLTSQYKFLGASAGGLAAAGQFGGGLETAAGIVTGAALGQVIGSHQQENTFIVIAQVSLALVDKKRGRSEGQIIFGKTGDSEKKKEQEFRSFKSKVKANIAVFAGGQNIRQSDVANEVIQRFRRILKDII